MATTTLKPRSHPEIFFRCPDDGGYVTMEWNGRMVQPCSGGQFRGSTLIADRATLKATARAWWRAYQRRLGA